mmetsp:Transcript_62315/g.110736  ORF Transcript_62315/g.110736 Transcript_62315/m.110736 type:complete len:556 (+) Transcript_62315:41-1708(+)
MAEDMSYIGTKTAGTAVLDGTISTTLPNEHGPSVLNSLLESTGSTLQDYTLLALADLDSSRTSHSLGRPAAIYPRFVTPAQITQDSDSDLDFCGPMTDPEESGQAEARHIHVWGIGVEEGEGRRRRRRGGGGGANLDENDPGFRPKGGAALVLPRGEIEGDSLKYICVFQIGLEDDEEFCLVKRILGKAGNNMRRIADDCNAKVRLRGIGSGFLEGTDGREANMPLQLNVSCVDFEEYVTAVDQVATLLKDLYKHYRRYARSKGMEAPDVKVNVEEVRRDDHAIDLLTEKANRTPSQRERDRRAREAERRLLKEREREKQALREANAKANGEPPPAPVIGMVSKLRPRSRERPIGMPYSDFDSSRSDSPAVHVSTSDDDVPKAQPTLPGGQPVPTTAAGRRAAARIGGAAAAAVASAAARNAEREERDRKRKEKEVKRRETEERASAVARRPGRNAPRGLGLLTRAIGDAQQILPGGAMPIGAGTAYVPQGKKAPKGTAYPAAAGAVTTSTSKAPPPPPPGPPPEDALVAGPVNPGTAAATATTTTITGRRRRRH